MSSGQAKVYVALCLCLVTPAAAVAGTVCATDDFYNTVVLKPDADLMLNGCGTFENVNPARPSTYEIIHVT